MYENVISKNMTGSQGKKQFQSSFQKKTDYLRDHYVTNVHVLMEEILHQTPFQISKKKKRL